MNPDFDVIVLGAGLAGLAAARLLVTTGKSVLICEARNRAGGRVFTNRDPATEYPIELGPEWVGAHGSVRNILDRANADVRTTSGTHLVRRDGAIVERESWKEMSELLERIRTLVDHGADRPLTEAIAAVCGDGELLEGRAALLSYVQGFHTADPARVSSRWLLEVEDNEPADASEGHALAGLDRGIDALLADLGELGTLKLNTMATRVQWTPSSVLVDAVSDGRSSTHSAKQLICALPLGVLKLNAGETGAVTFVPPLSDKRPAMGLVDTGAVIKMTFVFDEPFWRRIDKFGNASFIQERGVPLPTWWTTHPVDAAVITGWVAGPLVVPLDGIRGDALRDVALDSLASVLGVSRERVRQQLRGWHTHDWSADPFARGAYSYVLSGGTGAYKDLAKPIDNTLFFAGEYTCGQGHNATMEGAMQSGIRAAQELLACQ